MPLERLRPTRHRDSRTVAGGAALSMRERGAEAVEFALVVPVFLLLVFGVVDFGYMINRDTMVNNASREGARAGAFNPDQATIAAAVTTAMAAGGLALTIPPTVTCRNPDSTTNCKPGGAVIVTVAYKHSWITPVGASISKLKGWPPNTITLSKTTEMRIE
jgi:Flp pilus assembly protein TadG